MSTMAGTPKRRPRRKLSEELKEQAARLVLEEGKSMAAVARELDLVPTAVREWVERARADRSAGKTGLTTAEREELGRLRKQVRVLEEDRDILRKVAAFFAKHPAMRFGFSAPEKARHSATILCRCLRVTRRGFYAWARRGPSARAAVLALRSDTR